MLAAVQPPAAVPAWEDWHGGPCPVRLGDLFQIRYVDGIRSSAPRLADGNWLLDRVWEHQGNTSDIVAVRVVG